MEVSSQGQINTRQRAGLSCTLIFFSPAGNRLSSKSRASNGSLAMDAGSSWQDVMLVGEIDRQQDDCSGALLVRRQELLRAEQDQAQLGVEHEEHGDGRE